MNNVDPRLLGAIFGAFFGMLLYQLPFRLFYRNATWVTEEEFLAGLPEKKWVTKALYVLLPLGFTAFVVLMASTRDMNKWINWFFFFPMFFYCMGALPAIPELFAKASVLIPVGHGSRTSVQYTFSPNASRAGVFRLAIASLVVGVFLWCR
jgi:hypothetical protein